MAKDSALTYENLELQKCGFVLLAVGLVLFIVFELFEVGARYLSLASIGVMLMANVLLFITSNKEGRKKMLLVGGLLMISAIIMYFVISAQYPPPF